MTHLILLRGAQRRLLTFEFIFTPSSLPLMQKCSAEVACYREERGKWRKRARVSGEYWFWWESQQNWTETHINNIHFLLLVWFWSDHQLNYSPSTSQKMLILWLFLSKSLCKNVVLGWSQWSVSGLKLSVALPWQRAKAFLKRLFAEQGINPDYETIINQPLMLIS